MHGGEQFPVIIGEFVGDVFGAHLFQGVSCSSLWTLLLFQGHLGVREGEAERQRKIMREHKSGETSNFLFSGKGLREQRILTSCSI